MKLPLGNERTRHGAAGDAPATPAGRPRGTRIFWRCRYCFGKSAESRMACAFCFRDRLEAA